MFDNPCYYLHDHRDYSKKLLNQHLHAVHLFSTLCWHYDGIQKQLQSASNQKAHQLCQLFLEKTANLHLKASQLAPPKTSYAAIKWARRHFLKPAQVSSSMPHGCSIKLRATLHFQILSVNLSSNLCFGISLAMSGICVKFSNNKMYQHNNHRISHQKKQLLQKHRNYLAHKTKIKLNQHYQEMSTPYYPRHQNYYQTHCAHSKT